MATVVADASVLIALSEIGRLSLLKDLFRQVLIPPAVLREVQGSIAPLPEWVEVQAPSEASVSRSMGPLLDPGETEAIGLASDTAATLIILDDLPARRQALARGLPVVGTAGILVMAKRAGLIDSVRPDLDALRAHGFHLRQDVYVEVLRGAGELPEG